MESFLKLFCLIILLCLISKSSFSKHPLCHDNERAALLQFKLSLSISKFASIDLSAYPKIESWKLTGNRSNCCFWEGIGCDMASGHVTVLDLSSSFLSGSIYPNSTIFELVHLKTLNLADNNFKRSLIPAEISHLSNLKYLNLSQSVFSGQVPIEICQLSNLISLDLSSNVDPSSGGSLLLLRQPSLKTLLKSFSSLKELCLDEVSISSRVPKILANLTSLRYLSLGNCRLHSAFPKGIFLMLNLEVLLIHHNSNLVGYLPEFSNASKLRMLDLEVTGFSGRIPTSISNLGSLITFSISYCTFQGRIPYSLGKLTKLINLELAHNYFEGQIPPSLKNLTKLEYLVLSENMLTGEIPSFLANFTNLIYLELGVNNLHGSSITWISKLENLISLDLSSITLASPVEFGMFVKLKKLILLELSDVDLIMPIKGQKNDTYPQFQDLILEACNLTQFPNFLHNQTNLQELGLDLNKIQGSIPIPSQSLSVYDLSGNQLSGEIPPLICNMTSLIYLSLGDNSLSGKIPPCLFNLSNSLWGMELDGNMLQGTIPETFKSTCKLRVIDLGSNQLQGRVPRSLAKCSFLELLALNNNHIDDTFPTSLQGLPKLHSLLLGSNQLQGMLPNKVGHGFPSLHIIDLSYNELTGNLPYNLFLGWHAMEAKAQGDLGYMQITSSSNNASGMSMRSSFSYAIPISSKGREAREKVLKIFTIIVLSHNKFVRKIPESIGNLVGLEALDLSYNNLIGGIPSSLASLSNLESLDLSHNMLSGEISQQLTSLTFLEIFNVSFNNLTGPIPSGEQFNTFGNDSYLGNLGLCGTPLSKKCGNFEAQSPRQLQPHSNGEADEGSSTLLEWFIISMGYVSGLVIGMILGRLFTTAKHEWFIETFGRRHRNKRGAKKRDHYN